MLEVLKSVREVEQAARRRCIGSKPLLPAAAEATPLGGETQYLPPPPTREESEGIVESSKALPLSPPAALEEGLAEGFLEWGVRYALENLARAQDNGVFPRVVEQLQVRGRWEMGDGCVLSF